MIGQVNFTSYSSVEQMSGFSDRTRLVNYRNSRISRYRQHVEFMINRSIPAKLSVIEIGSGSSGLLYAFAEKNLLEKAIGIELSESRFRFAEEWKKDNGYGMVQNINANFAEVEMGTSEWDWFVVIDNTFTYLAPENSAYPSLLLKKAFSALKDDGKLVIDFINYAAREQNKEIRHWGAFSKEDPFSYGLYSNRVIDGNNHSESIFIKRDGSETTKTDISKVYSLEDISTMLSAAGFKVDGVYAAFDGTAFDATNSERLLVIAKKISSHQ